MVYHTSVQVCIWGLFMAKNLGLFPWMSQMEYLGGYASVCLVWNRVYTYSNLFFWGINLGQQGLRLGLCEASV